MPLTIMVPAADPPAVLVKPDDDISSCQSLWLIPNSNVSYKWPPTFDDRIELLFLMMGENDNAGHVPAFLTCSRSAAHEPGQAAYPCMALLFISHLLQATEAFLLKVAGVCA